MLALDIECVSAVDITDPRIAALAARREQTPEQFACLFPAMAKVVCVAFRNTDSGNGRTLICSPMQVELSDVTWCSDERELLLAAADVIGRHKALLTFNGKSYDVPVLVHRMIINAVSFPSLLLRAARAKPWENELHTDVASMLNFGGAFGRYALQAYALAYGLADPKADGDGSHVGVMMAEGRYGDVARYCMGDVDTTVALWRAWQ